MCVVIADCSHEENGRCCLRSGAIFVSVLGEISEGAKPKIDKNQGNNHVIPVATLTISSVYFSRRGPAKCIPAFVTRLIGARLATE